MPRLLRTVLTWLLALALPVQGHAAQAMLFCGPVHDGVSAVSAVAHDHAAHGHGGWKAGLVAQAQQAGAHDHAGMGHGVPPAAGMQGQAQPDEPDDGTAAGTASQAKCSVCASCCSMAAIASAYALPDAVPLSFEYVRAPFEPRDGCTAAGLERPPKTRLA